MCRKSFRGDYINMSATLDLTLSTIDNALLTGTGLSGALRALEQAWGRDPEHDDPRCPLHAEPERRPGRTAGRKGRVTDADPAHQDPADLVRQC